MSPTCSHQGCDRRSDARGLCKMHYKRWWKATPKGEREQVQPVDAWTRIKDKITVSDAGCWEWSGCLNTSGYAWMFFKGRSIAVSRVMWQLTNGEIHSDLFVLHRCDNRRCVNPKHLFLGTNATNMADMVAKGRSPRSRAKLTEEDVMAIRSEADLPIEQLARKYAVSKATICNVTTRRTWRHI